MREIPKKTQIQKTLHFIGNSFVYLVFFCFMMLFALSIGKIFKFILLDL